MAKRKAGHELDVRSLLSQAEDLPYGRAKTGLLEEAVRLADAHSDVPLGFEARMELIDAATFSGEPQVAIVAYSWCLALADKDPDRYEHYDLLWRYKWIASRVPMFPEVSRQQIDDMLSDMEKRYLRNSGGQHPIQSTILGVAITMGDLPRAKEAHAKLQSANRTWLSNCPACELDGQVDFYFRSRRRKTALKKAEPIFAKKMTCSTIPHRTYSKVLLPLLEEGDPARAADYHRKGYRLIGTNPEFIGNAADHIRFLTLTQNDRQALRALERHLPNALASHCPDTRFEFFLATVFLLDHLADDGKKLRIRLPAAFPAPESVDRTSAAALRDWFRAETETIATAFDARNGNDHYSRQLKDLAKLKKRIKPYPI